MFNLLQSSDTVGEELSGHQRQPGNKQCNYHLSYCQTRPNLYFKPPLSLPEHRSSDTGGGGFAAQLHGARGDDIWESGLGNPVCQAHLHSNPGGRKPSSLHPHRADTLPELGCWSYLKGSVAVEVHVFIPPAHVIVCFSAAEHVPYSQCK